MPRTPAQKERERLRRLERIATEPGFKELNQKRNREHRRNWIARQPEAYLKARAKHMAARRGDGLTRIYFIQTASGPIKIGLAKKSPVARMAELQVGNHERLILLTSFVGTSDNELELHKRFAHLNVRGEWFLPAPELLSYIISLSSERTYPSA